MEVQRLGAPPMRVTESPGEEGFTARASLDRDGETVGGQPCSDASKKRASQGAAVSLLAGLAGIPVPAARSATEPAGPARPNPGPGGGSRVAPTDLEGFAPGVTVRRYHATGRSLGGLVSGEVVLTTYGTLLRDAEALADVPWDLVVA